MKHMVDTADGQTIFVYAITDRNMTSLEKANKGKDKANDIDVNDTIPFYNKFGFAVSKKFQEDHETFIPPGTFPMVATKMQLQNCLRSMKNYDVANIKFLS